MYTVSGHRVNMCDWRMQAYSQHHASDYLCCVHIESKHICFVMSVMGLAVRDHSEAVCKDALENRCQWLCQYVYMFSGSL